MTTVTTPPTKYGRGIDRWSWLPLLVGALLLLGTAAASAGSGSCRIIIPDDEIHCPYHALNPGDDVVFLDLDSGAIRTTRSDTPDDATTRVLMDPFIELGWTPGPASVSPDGEHVLVARTKPECPGWTGVPGAGLQCSYGRPTLWLAEHRVGDPEDPDDDEWVHTNLSLRLLGRNSEVHGWSTWLHRDVALFNAIVFPDDGGWYVDPVHGYDQSANSAQIYALRLSPGEPRIEPYAPAFLWRSACLTGRVDAQPSEYPNRCTAGQRLSIVRRCYDEADTAHGWAWFNTSNLDGTGERCRPDMAEFAVPVLRTYVIELDESCQPTHPFEDLRPVRSPPDDAVHRQMGLTPEWGDMLSAISADGNWIAVATNTGDPAGDLEDNCAGFGVNLRDPSDALSGNSLRWTHVCHLDEDLQCDGQAVPAPVELHPPEATVLPGFVASLDAPLPSLVVTREWGIVAEPLLRDIVRLDYRGTASGQVPFRFGRHATAAAPIRRSRALVRRAPRRIAP